MTARRSTPQRAAIAAALDEQETFVSAQTLHARLRDGGSPVGLATVYRTLQQLAEDGLADVLRTDDGEAQYRRCSEGHHHHLVCRTCGRTEEIEDPEVGAWAAKVAGAHGFTDVEHQVELFGTCAGCR